MVVEWVETRGVEVVGSGVVVGGTCCVEVGRVWWWWEEKSVAERVTMW